MQVLLAINATVLMIVVLNVIVQKFPAIADVKKAKNAHVTVVKTVTAKIVAKMAVAKREY